MVTNGRHAGQAGQAGEWAADSEGWVDVDLEAVLPAGSNGSGSAAAAVVGGGGGGGGGDATAALPFPVDSEGDGVEQVQDPMASIYCEITEMEGKVPDDRIVEALIDIHARRRDTVRAMVRGLVLRYPLILGTSLSRIQDRLQELKTDGHLAPLDTVGWPDIVNFIRRAPPAHKRWLGKGRATREKEEKEEMKRR